MSLLNGSITGSAIRWPSWVLFQCSLSVSTFEMAKNPCVVLGKRVSLGRLAGAAATARPDNSSTELNQHEAHFKDRGTAQLLVSIGAGIVYLILKFERRTAEFSPISQLTLDRLEKTIR